MTLRVFLVDDEPPARARMRQLLSHEPDVVIVGEAADAQAAREAIATTHPDVLFLDVEMPEESGTSLAQSLPEPRPYVVFATAYDRYALDAFALDATDYLVKPITRARLAATLARIRERLSRRSDLERDLALASAAQAALLPRTMPEIPGFAAAALTVAARGVGGDFFVAQALTGARHVLALGDVAGKGIPAGLVASSLQARIEAMTRHAPGDASAIVADVNRTLCESSDGSRFATLVYVDVHAPAHEDTTVTVVNAGHLPAIIMGSRGRLDFVPSAGPALGLIPTAHYPSTPVAMQDGETLVLYSDGVTEAFSADGEEFGESRLLQLLAQHATSSPQVLCDAVISAVRSHSGGVLRDDVTMMALSKTSRERVHP